MISDADFLRRLADELDHPTDVTVTLCYSATGGEVQLTLVIATGIEVPKALDLLRKTKPMEWWKRSAFMRLVVDDVIRATPATADQGPTIATLRAAMTTPITPRRRRATDAHLLAVAETYRAAWQDGSPPTKAVAAAFSVSHSTAARWVGAARKAGHLGPSDSSRGGERDQTTQPGQERS